MSSRSNGSGCAQVKLRTTSMWRGFAQTCIRCHPPIDQVGVEQVSLHGNLSPVSAAAMAALVAGVSQSALALGSADHAPGLRAKSCATYTENTAHAARFNGRGQMAT